METIYGLPFVVLECPNIKLKKPSWLHMPSAMTVYAIVIVSYFLITGGECYAHAKLTLTHTHTHADFSVHSLNLLDDGLCMIKGKRWLYVTPWL